MKILFLTNIPSPYRIDFFNELGRQCELDVLFEREASSERDDSWKNYQFVSFNGEILRGINVGKDKAIPIKVIPYLKKEYDYIVVANPLTPCGIMAILWMKMRHKKYFIEGDGVRHLNVNPIYEIIKKVILKNAEGYFSTSVELDKYFMRYGAEKRKIYRYPFSSIHECDILEEKGNKVKEESRKNLGIGSEKTVILSVGRFDYMKGFDILIKCMKSIPNAVCYIVGGEATEEYKIIMSKENISNIVFVEFKTKEKLRDYYIAADIFVFPTRSDAWGLVINEAMAYGAPIISTDGCVAALELIENGKNGIVVSSDSVEETTEAIIELISDKDKLKEIEKNNLSKIKDYTIEKMAQRHIEIFEGLRK